MPAEKDVMGRQGIHVSGMVIGRAFTPESEPGRMYIQFVDEASIAEQSRFHLFDQVASIDGIAIDSYETALKTLKEKTGKTAEFTLRRERVPAQGTGVNDYLVRTLDVQNIFEITGSGIKP